jgi:hypothetical protein
MTGRDRKVIAAVCVLAAVIAGWLLVIGPKRSQASKLESQITTAQAQLNSARAEVTQSETARKSFSGDYAALVRLGEAVPPDDNVPSLLVELQRAAAATGVDFRNLALVPGAGAGSAPAPTPAPTTPTTSSSSSSTSTTPASTAAPSTPAPASTTTPASSSAAVVSASATALPPGAAVGPAGFPTEEFTLTFEGNFFRLSNFFQRLESFVTVSNSRVAVSGRLMTLNAITLGAASQGFPEMDATVSATTYLVPAAQGLLNGATTSGPATGTGQTVSGTASSSSAPPTAAIAAPSTP